jgi:small subunit ribosomal protein S8
MNNHVCNMISAISNGQLAKKPFVLQKKKKVCEHILNILWDEGFILGYKNSKHKPNTLKIFLKYQNGNPVIQLIKVLSKPSLRVYYSVKQLWKLEPSKGTIVVSTTKGFMSSSDCKKKTIGGEPFIIVK